MDGKKVVGGLVEVVVSVFNWIRIVLQLLEWRV